MRIFAFRRAAILSAALFFSFAFVSGCSEERPQLSGLKVVSGADQCTADPAGRFSRPLVIEARGGRNGRMPMPGVRLVFASEPGSALRFEPESGVTDGGGMLAVTIAAGKTGDQFFTVSAPEYHKCFLRLRVVNGVELRGDRGEAVAGTKLKKPVAVRLVKDGRGVPGVPVRFGMRATVEGAETSAVVATPYCVTDADGVASTEVTLGKATGGYRLGIDVDGESSGFAVRCKEILLLAVNPWKIFMAVAGGVAFFIFGMSLVGDGLRAAAGDRLKNLLQLFTRNRVTGLIAGTLVTAGLQSSTAVTVMVTGFINAGLLTLKQSLGIIFGANIGTTVTAQIISFDLSGAVLPAVAIGMMMSISKKRSLKGWGMAVLGFGMLFMGMEMMGGELKLLSDVPSFKRIFLFFDCAPRNGVVPALALAGAAAAGFFGTAVLHSSAAFAGLTLALAAGGLVNFYTAFALLIGSNVGTTVTTLVASAQVNRVAKQAALAHFIFNLLGALLMIALFYVPWRGTGHPVFLELVDRLTPGDAFAAIPQNLERHIAMAHTFFNVAVALALLPFVSQFAWLCEKLLPIRDEKSARIRMLEPGLLGTPSVALKQCASALRVMVETAWKMIDRSLNDHFMTGSLKHKRIAAIEEMEEQVDAMQKEITDYLVQLMRQRLTAPQSELIPLLMHATNDAERIADHAENIIALTRRMVENDDKLSEGALKSLERMWEVLDDEARQVISGLGGAERKPVKLALKDERRINKMADKFESDHISRLREGTCSAPAGVIYIEMLGELEKIGDRLTNIAERTPQIQRHYVKL